MKKWFDFFAFLVLFAVIMGVCGCSAGRIPVPEPPRTAWEEIDPFEFGDEFSFPPHAVRRPVPDGGGDAESLPETVQVPASRAETTGSVVSPKRSDGVIYRVQIGIFEDRDSAEKCAGDARAGVSEKVYIEFEAPFFRVRVGDFVTRREAEAYVKILQDSGFHGSFWIMKNVGTP